MQVSVAVGFEPARHFGLVERLEAELLLTCDRRCGGAMRVKALRQSFSLPVVRRGLGVRGGALRVRAMLGVGLRARNSLVFTVRVRVTVS